MLCLLYFVDISMKQDDIEIYNIKILKEIRKKKISGQ